MLKYDVIFVYFNYSEFSIGVWAYRFYIQNCKMCTHVLVYDTVTCMITLLSYGTLTLVCLIGQKTSPHILSIWVCFLLVDNLFYYNYYCVIITP